MTNLELLKNKIESASTLEIISMLGLTGDYSFLFRDDETKERKNYVQIKKYLEIPDNKEKFIVEIQDMNAEDVLTNFMCLSCEFCNNFQSPACHAKNGEIIFLDKCKEEQIAFLKQDCLKNNIGYLENYCKYKLSKEDSANDKKFYNKIFELIHDYNTLQDKIQKINLSSETKE